MFRVCLVDSRCGLQRHSDNTPVFIVVWNLDFSIGYRGHRLLQTDCICIIIYLSGSKPSLFLYASHLFARYGFCSRHIRLTFLSELHAYKNYWENIFLRSRAVCFVISPPRTKHSLFCYSADAHSTEKGPFVIAIYMLVPIRNLCDLLNGKRGKGKYQRFG